MGDIADDHADAFADGDYADDDGGGDGVLADYRYGLGPVIYSHARLAPAPLPPINLGRARVLRESEKGIRVDRFNGKPPEWVPKSQIALTSQVKNYPDDGDLIVSAWIAQEKGWTPPAPPPPRARTIKSVRRLVVDFDVADGAWTREALLSELRRISGIRGVEILECTEHGDK